MSTVLTPHPPDLRTQELDDILDALAGWPGHVGLRHLIRTLVRSGTVTSVVGPSGSGKTRMLLSYLDGRDAVYFSTYQDSEELARILQSLGTSWPYAFGCEQLPCGRSIQQLISWASTRRPGFSRIIVADSVALPSNAARTLTALRTLCQRRGVALVLSTVPSIHIEGADTEITISPDPDEWLSPRRTVSILEGKRKHTVPLVFDSEGRLVQGNLP